MTLPAGLYAHFTTSEGAFTVRLFEEEAPTTVATFAGLAEGRIEWQDPVTRQPVKRPFYDGLIFHRVEPGFVIQGGDPEGTGTGGPGYTIPAEINHKHVRGALAWARTGDQVNPERASSGSQFYITLQATPFLDGQYTAFGQVTQGMDVVLKIA